MQGGTEACSRRIKRCPSPPGFVCDCFPSAGPPAPANTLLRYPAAMCLGSTLDFHSCRPCTFRFFAPVRPPRAPARRSSPTSCACGRQSAAACVRSRLLSTHDLRALSSSQGQWSLLARQGRCCTARRSGSSWRCAHPSMTPCGAICGTARWRWACEPGPMAHQRAGHGLLGRQRNYATACCACTLLLACP